MIDNPTCEACGLEVENSGHLFWNWEKTRSIWELSGLPLDMNGLRFQEFIDFLWHLKFVQNASCDIM